MAATGRRSGEAQCARPPGRAAWGLGTTLGSGLNECATRRRRAGQGRGVARPLPPALSPPAAGCSLRDAVGCCRRPSPELLPPRPPSSAASGDAAPGAIHLLSLEPVLDLPHPRRLPCAQLRPAPPTGLRDRQNAGLAPAPCGSVSARARPPAGHPARRSTFAPHPSCQMRSRCDHALLRWLVALARSLWAPARRPGAGRRRFAAPFHSAQGRPPRRMDAGQRQLAACLRIEAKRQGPRDSCAQPSPHARRPGRGDVAFLCRAHLVRSADHSAVSWSGRPAAAWALVWPAFSRLQLQLRRRSGLPERAPPRGWLVAVFRAGPWAMY